MKILFIEPCPKDFLGYFRAFNICQALSLKKHQITLLVAAKDRFSPIIKSHPINHYFKIIELPKIYLNLYFQGRIIRGLIATLYGLFGHYDIVHIAMPQLPESTIPATILKILGKKIVIDWDEMYQNGTYKNNFLTHLYIKIFENFFPKFIKNYTVCSYVLKQAAEKRGATNVLKIINGVNTYELQPITKSAARRQLRLDPRGFYLISFGNTYSGRRITLLVKVLKKLVDLDRNIKLLTNFPEIFPRQLQPNIIDIGRYNPLPKLGIYLSAADVALFLMDNNQTDRSCYPARVSTYIAGKTIVAINDNDGEVCRTLKPFNCIITAKNTKTLAEKIYFYLHHPNQFNELRKNTLKTREELSTDKIVIPLIKYYQQILNS